MDDVVVAVVWAVVTLVLAGAAAAISLRLLGVGRGWTKALGAAVVGWGIGGVVALGLSDWDWGADGLILHTLAIAVAATMVAAVLLDLLAPPGSLAMGERAGLIMTPRPLRSLRRRVAVFRRYRELLDLLRREGFGPTGGRGFVDEGAGVRLRTVLEEAGGVYIKLGQIAATRVDIVPLDVADSLAQLQNDVPPEPREAIQAVLEAELGAPADEVFAEFDWDPLAAASIGQTHRARLRTGERVVVKIQRPGIEAMMERDLAALSLLANLAQRRTALGQGMRSGDMVAQFAVSLRAELDFRREADAMEEMGSLLADRSPVRIPRVHRYLSTRRLLVQERFEGCTLTDGDQLDEWGVDRPALAEQLLHSTLDQVLRAGFFHADPHPGNVFAFPDGTLGLIDFGAVGRLDSIQLSAVVDMFAAVTRNDVSLLREGIERVADVTGAGTPEQLERALARLLADHVRPNGSVDPTVLQDLVGMLTRFGVRLPGDLVILSRALVTLDGTLRTLAPGMSLIAAATAMMTDGQAAPIIDREALLRAELEAALPHLRHLPDRIDRILTLAGRGDLRVRHVVDEDGQRILRTLVNRSLLAVIGAAFLLVSALLLVAADEGPAVAEDTGLFEVFGFGGLLIGSVLLLRVVAAVARDGTT
ncbi:MAG: AarF/UbiB family protein [Acidimicrobiales bacterium]